MFIIIANFRLCILFSFYIEHFLFTTFTFSAQLLYLTARARGRAGGRVCVCVWTAYNISSTSLNYVLLSRKIQNFPTSMHHITCVYNDIIFNPRFKRLHEGIGWLFSLDSNDKFLIFEWNIKYIVANLILFSSVKNILFLSLLTISFMLASHKWSKRLFITYQDHNLCSFLHWISHSI